MAERPSQRRRLEEEEKKEDEAVRQRRAAAVRAEELMRQGQAQDEEEEEEKDDDTVPGLGEDDADGDSLYTCSDHDDPSDSDDDDEKGEEEVLSGDENEGKVGMTQWTRHPTVFVAGEAALEGGPTHITRHAVTELDFLKLFLTPAMMARLVEDTNKYAQRKKPGTDWTITVEKMWVYIGVMIYMGVHVESEVTAYWHEDPDHYR